MFYCVLLSGRGGGEARERLAEPECPPVDSSVYPGPGTETDLRPHPASSSLRPRSHGVSLELCSGVETAQTLHSQTRAGAEERRQTECFKEEM